MEGISTAKRKASEKIERQTLEFFARGGAIREFPPGASGERLESWQQKQARLQENKKRTELRNEKSRKPSKKARVAMSNIMGRVFNAEKSEV